MKYIDAEKLIAEIERREKIIRNCSNQISDSDKKTYYSGCADALLELRPIITSLQQDQPEVDLEKEIKAEWDVIDPDLLRFEEFKAVCYRFYEFRLNTRK